MKRLALLLSSLVAVSSVAMAKEVAPAPTVAVEPTVVIKEVKVQPDFRITSVNVKMLAENRDNGTGKNHGKYDLVDGDGYFATTASFAYKKDWTGALTGRRYFVSDTKGTYNGTEKIGVYEKGSPRVILSAKRNNLELGPMKYSLEGLLEFRDKQDFYGVKIAPQFSFAPWLVGTYRYDYRANSVTHKTSSTSTNSDIHFFEALPTIKLWGGYSTAFFYEHQEDAGASNKRSRLSQLRLYTPSYKLTEKLRLAFEYRGTISADRLNAETDEVWAIRGTVDKPFEMNRIYAKSTYALTESTSLNFTYYYEFGKWQTASDKKQKGYMSGIDLGVTFRF